jgi:hypothetical protein
LREVEGEAAVSILSSVGERLAVAVVLSAAAVDASAANGARRAFDRCRAAATASAPGVASAATPSARAGRA